MDKLPGLLFVFISTIGYGLIPVLMKKSSSKLPPFTIMAVSMFVLFITSLILSILFEKSLLIKYANFRNEILVLVIAGLVNTLAFYLAIMGYKYMPLWQQTLFTLLTPLLSGLFAFWILQESLNPKLFVGLMIMGFGLLYAIL